MSPGEICLASFPFGDVPGMKLRPVLLLTGVIGSVPEVLVAYITSVVPSSMMATDVLLDPSVGHNVATGLKTRSVLRLHKLATIHETSIVRKLGQISMTVSNDVNDRLRVMLDL